MYRCIIAFALLLSLTACSGNINERSHSTSASGTEKELTASAVTSVETETKSTENAAGSTADIPSQESTAFRSTEEATESEATKLSPETSGADSEALSFAARLFYLQYNAKRELYDALPIMMLVESEEKLQSFIDMMDGFSAWENMEWYYGRHESIPFREALESYDAAWFEAHQLLLAVLAGGASSHKDAMTIPEISRKKSGQVEIVVRTEVSGWQTGDSVPDIFLIELPKGSLQPTDTFDFIRDVIRMDSTE